MVSVFPGCRDPSPTCTNLLVSFSGKTAFLVCVKDRADLHCLLEGMNCGKPQTHKNKSYKSQGEQGWKPNGSQHLGTLNVGRGVLGPQNQNAAFEQSVKGRFRKLFKECRVFTSKP